jgi:hypothetical protein
MFWLAMRPNRTLRVGFALLFALMLPLQGYAAMPGCGGSDHAATHHCGSKPAPAAHHPNCGDCCCAVAIAFTLLSWAPPRPTAPELSDTSIRSPPAVALDRLDRPPRPNAV